MIRTVALLACLMAALATMAADVQIEPDRMAVVDGKRTFILGLYENPTDDAVMKAAVDAGFNLIQSPPDAAALDRLHAAGAYAWVNTGYDIDLSDDAANREAGLRALAEGPVADHPALLCWEVPDEALWNCWYGSQQWRMGLERGQQRPLIEALTDQNLRAQLTDQREDADRLFTIGEFEAGEQLADDIWVKLGKPNPNPDLKLSTAKARAHKMRDGMLQGYTLLKQLDAHPVWMNHAPRNQIAQLKAYADAADIVGCDIYPVPPYRSGHCDISDRSVAAAGAYTKRMQESAPGKPVWMVLQGFGWPDIQEREPEDAKNFPRPAMQQTRFMAYDAIVNGARGILYWGTFSIEKDSQFWKDLLTLAAEIKAFDWLAAPDADIALTVTLEETWGSVDKGVAVLPKQTDKGVVLLVVNEWQEPLEFTIQGVPPSPSWSEHYTQMKSESNGGPLRARIPGQTVQIWSPVSAS